MGFDQFVNYSGWLIGIAGFGFGIWQYRVSQSRLVIRDIRAGLRSLGPISSGKRTVEVTAISVKVDNKGLQPAKCSGLVHFARSNALPLHLIFRGRAQQNESFFVVEGRDEAELIAAWDVTDGIIGMRAIPYADFVRDYLPATVVITIGKRSVKAILTEKETSAAYQRFEQDCFKMGA